jgi:hypothetical protein
MKSVSYVLTTAIVIATTAFSSAASASTIDFDINDDTHVYSRPIIQDGSWEWFQPYAGYLSYYVRFGVPVLPALGYGGYTYLFSEGLADPGHSQIQLYLTLPGAFDPEASWIEFDDGNRVSLQSLVGSHPALGEEFGGTYYDIYDYPFASYSYYWNWDWDPAKSPDGFPSGVPIARNAMPTHVQITFYPPAVPEPETCAMLLAGLGIVSAVARRRRK